MKTRPRAKKLKPGMPESRVVMGVAQAAAFWDVELDRQNTGAMKNASGQLVRFGVRGNSDLTGMTGRSWGERRGRKVDVEAKREGWKPPKPPAPGKPPSKARQHWARQLERLRRTNEQGGYGFWTDDPEHAFEVFKLLKSGECVGIEIGDDEECYLIPAEADGRAGMSDKQMNKAQIEYVTRLIRDESEELTEKAAEFRKIADKVRGQMPNVARGLEECSQSLDDAVRKLRGERLSPEQPR